MDTVQHSRQVLELQLLQEKGRCVLQVSEGNVAKNNKLWTWGAQERFSKKVKTHTEVSAVKREIG